ncbi:MAG: hypothetical protein OEV66_02050 [Spirochaetia bacterium]|nr:hypothetical protein [Spirochaetia bacterium]
MKNKAIIPVIIGVFTLSSFCDRKQQPPIRFLSFHNFTDSASPAKKNLEIFEGDELNGSVLSVGKRPQVFTILPADEIFIYAVRETTLVDLKQGTNELKPGEALFVPAKTLFRLSSKNEKFESKVIIVRSNKADVELLADPDLK